MIFFASIFSLKPALYKARHSWASAAKGKNIPISVISEGMGHDSEATTQIYSGQSQRTDIKGFVEPYEVFSKTITFYVRET